MPLLLALDPGMNSPGVALFQGGVLVDAWRVEVPDSFAQYEEAGQRWLAVALEISASIQRRCWSPYDITEVVFEKPQWYQRGKSKGDPNQLVGVAGVAANLTGRLLQYAVFKVRSPEPSKWIGQITKICPTCEGKKTVKAAGKRVKAICPACNSTAWGTPRGKYIAARLHSYEYERVPDQNDAIDAVGIGLWALGRLAPRSVFSNGRDGR